VAWLAAATFAGEIDGVLMLALSEREDGSGRSLIIQRGLQPDTQDRRLGLDTYSVSTESGATEYGALKAWDVATGAILLDLEPRAARALGVDEAIEIGINADRLEAVAAIVEQLTKLRPGDINER
jgi:Immunity protein 10